MVPDEGHLIRGSDCLYGTGSMERVSAAPYARRKRNARIELRSNARFD